MPVGAGEGLRGLLVHRQGRCDVEHRQTAYRFGLVGGQPVRDASPAVMGEHVEPAVTKGVHYDQHVLTHDALGVVGVVVVAGRLAGVAVSTKVGEHQGELFRQHRRDPVPDGASLWVSVQKKQRWPGSSGDAGDFDAIDGRDRVLYKAGK